MQCKETVILIVTAVAKKPVASNDPIKTYTASSKPISLSECDLALNLYGFVQ